MQPRQVHKNAVNGIIENVNFLFCPPERLVVVPVPVKVCCRCPPPACQALPSPAALPGCMVEGTEDGGGRSALWREEEGKEVKGQA